MKESSGNGLFGYPGTLFSLRPYLGYPVDSLLLESSGIGNRLVIDIFLKN
jgi:hypothetical protein